MSSYAELKQRADELLQQAEELRAVERAEVLSQTRDVIAEWAFTSSELGFRQNGSVKKPKLPAKYRDPHTGKDWCGKGAMPRWLVDHLRAGHTKEQFLIA